MTLTLLHIISFGGLNNYEIRLDDGVNVLYGPNESGKSSVAMFVKFMFYGLSAKPPRGSDISERDRYINRLTGQAAGFLLLKTDDGTEYRIERAILTSDDAPTRERVRIINRATGETVTGKNPGEVFFGVGEEVFLNTCFVGQTAASGTDSRPHMQPLENLLTSADESVDIQKAVRTLDTVRREICHKNGSGGELNDLRSRRAALAEEIRNASGTSADIIRLNASLNDICSRIGELTEDKRRHDGIFQCLDKILLRRRLANAAQIEADIAALRATIAELDASPLGSGFSEAVENAERDIRAYAEACASCGTETSSDRPASAFPDEDTAVPDETLSPVAEPSPFSGSDPSPVEQAHRLADRAHTQFTVSISLFLAGLFGFAASLLMYSFNQDAYILPLLLTLAAVSAGVVLILLHSRSSSALTNLLAEYSVDSPEELEQLFLALPPDESSDVPEPEDLPVPDDPSDAENPLLTQAQEHFDAALDAVRELCRTAGIAESSDIGDTLQALRKAADDIRADRETMADKLANLTGKLEVLNEQLADIDRNQAEADYREALEHPFGKTADALTAADIKSLMKERDFTAGALRSAEKRRLDLETQLAALGSPANPEETATALDELDRRIEELSLRHDACELAKNALLTASDNLRSGVIPKIAANASILLSGATSGTHETLTLDSALNAGCSTDADILSGEHLSRGTSDLAYLALRVALAEEIFKTETPFLLFDESFSHIDSARIRGMVSLLLDGQHLILTCRREEAEAAESAGAAILRL